MRGGDARHERSTRPVSNMLRRVDTSVVSVETPGWVQTASKGDCCCNAVATIRVRVRVYRRISRRFNKKAVWVLILTSKHLYISEQDPTTGRGITSTAAAVHVVYCCYTKVVDSCFLVGVRCVTRRVQVGGQIFRFARAQSYHHISHTSPGLSMRR